MKYGILISCYVALAGHQYGWVQGREIGEKGDKILFAAHAERYSRVKNDSKLNKSIVNDLLHYGQPTKICYYEKPLLKTARKLYSRQWPIFDNIKSHLADLGLNNIPIYYTNHHHAHAAMGYFTSNFEDAAILVIDAIGEWNTTSLWHGKENRLSRIMSVNYPHSFGIFYSALTQAIGLKPNEEEYILMGMAAVGKPFYVKDLMNEFFAYFKPPYIKLRYNLHHGIGDYIKQKNWNLFDVAASVQKIAEQYIVESSRYIKNQTKSKNLVLVGGVALNCVANSNIRDNTIFENIWVPPNPGDAGLSLGAILAHSNRHIEFDNAYLGYDIQRPLDVGGIIEELVNNKIVGIANGRAEWGPRALGNRSLLADPRGNDIKDKVNTIKKREQFRPFAPVVMAEHKEFYFKNCAYNQEYMQYTNKCLYPQEFPAICHSDNTSRLQSVPANNSNIRRILEAWYKRTNCPMLLNTSLNVKGEPLVNTWQDAVRFMELNDLRIY